MSHKKISVVVLGSDAALKRDLITNIIGRDEAVKTRVLKETEIYENKTYRVICTPDFNKLTNIKDIRDIKEVFAICYPVMSLLAVKEGFSTEEVWEQMEELHQLTGKPIEEFTVVLPLSHKHADSYPFRCCDLSKLISDLSRMAEHRDLKPTSTSRAAHPDEGVPMEVAGNPSDTRVNLVLLGMSGTGKSASGNTILGRTIFTSKASSSPVTAECRAEETVIGGRRVRVIDTPDIFDDDINRSTKEEHVRKCRELSEDGSTVFLLVMHVSRFTDGERGILKKMGKAFGSKVHDQTLILFTREDDLKQGEMTEDDFMRSFTPDLKKIVERCGNRCVWFENKASGSDQVKRLMEMVHQMITWRNSNCSSGGWWNMLGGAIQSITGNIPE